MKLEDSSEESMSSGGGDSPVEIFWQRYQRLVVGRVWRRAWRCGIGGMWRGSSGMSLS